MKTVHLIYMAAGNSRRFGSNKLLHKLAGKELYKYGYEVIKEVAKNQDLYRTNLTVVTQFDEVSDYVTADGGNVVMSPMSELGVSYTINAGIGEVQKSLNAGDYLLFMVADQPYIKAESINRLIAEVVKKGAAGGMLTKGGKGGNPCMFRADLVPELEQLSGDEGGKKVLKNHQYMCVEAVDTCELTDIDTVSDIEKL